MTTTKDVLTSDLRPDHDRDWLDLKKQFSIRPGTTYLNHGSFGVSPNIVREVRRGWIEQLESQPMDFYVRLFEPALARAKSKLAQFMGTTPGNLVFAENATFGMNVVADSFPLASGDQVLINNHEYGAVRRIWQRACERSQSKLIELTLPERFESHQQIVDAILQGVTAKTKLIVVSHITSPTGLIIPVEALCREARSREVAVCIDGPHALAQLPVKLDELCCDFYTASCHKWLSAPLGSGFLFVHPKWQDDIQPQLKSWGRLLPSVPESWEEEFIWSGTRDPSAYLSIPAAIEFLEQLGLDHFRRRTHALARQAQQRLSNLTGHEPIASDFDLWYGTMSHVPLPHGDWSALQEQLWQAYQIEVPIVNFKDRWYIRVSWHLYNDTSHLELLESALRDAIASKAR